MPSHHAADPAPLLSVAHALPAELLILYESARVLSLPQFELAAVRQLGRLVGFDGGVWGIGGSNRSTGVFEISHATLLDRPSRLLSEYAAVAVAPALDRRSLPWRMRSAVRRVRLRVRRAERGATLQSRAACPPSHSSTSARPTAARAARSTRSTM
ncbi:MAG: hypothetical protein ACSLE9_18065 [Burkholderiaceae bacterium]